MSTIFPGSASVGQIFDNYTFDGTAWNINGIDLTADYLETSAASATYLTKVSASNTYITQTSASSTYQPIISGVSNTEIGYLDGVTSGIQTQLNSKQTLQDSGWINVSSLANGFTAPTTVAYRKLNGVVYLRGNLYNGTANTGAFTLPSGYRPSVDVVVPVQKYGTSDNAYVTVGTDGVVVPNSTAAWLSSVIFSVG